MTWHACLRATGRRRCPSAKVSTSYSERTWDSLEPIPGLRFRLFCWNVQSKKRSSYQNLNASGLCAGIPTKDLPTCSLGAEASRQFWESSSDFNTFALISRHGMPRSWEFARPEFESVHFEPRSRRTSGVLLYAGLRDPRTFAFDVFSKRWMGNSTTNMQRSVSLVLVKENRRKEHTF